MSTRAGSVAHGSSTTRSSSASSPQVSPNVAAVAASASTTACGVHAGVLLQLVHGRVAGRLDRPVGGTGEMPDQGVDVELGARRRAAELVRSDVARGGDGEVERGLQLRADVGQLGGAGWPPRPGLRRSFRWMGGGGSVMRAPYESEPAILCPVLTPLRPHGNRARLGAAVVDEGVRTDGTVRGRGGDDHRRGQRDRPGRRQAARGEGCQARARRHRAGRAGHRRRGVPRGRRRGPRRRLRRQQAGAASTPWPTSASAASARST